MIFKNTIFIFFIFSINAVKFGSIMQLFKSKYEEQPSNDPCLERDKGR